MAKKLERFHYTGAVLLLDFWTLDWSPCSIPAVNSIRTHPVASPRALSPVWVSFHLQTEPNETQKCKKRIYKTQQKLTSPAASVPGCFFLVFSSLQMIDLFIISTWGNAIHHQPSVYRHEPIDFFVCMYYIKMTVNDWEIYRTYILFCYISYIHKYIYIKNVYNILNLFLFFHLCDFFFFF